MIPRLLSIALATVLLASACGDGGQVAARVNGTEIPLAEVAELRTEPTVEAGSDQFLSDLFRVVASEALAQAVEEEFDATVSEERVAEAEQELRDQLAQQGPVEDVLAESGFTVAMLERVAFEQALRELIEEELGSSQDPPTEEEAREAYEEGLTRFAEVCTHHILVETEEEAEAVVRRLEEGESFAEVAEDVSLDEGAEGGDLGCNVASVFVPEFAFAVLEAPVGEVSGPVHSQFGWHVIRVDSREVTPFEEVRDQVVEELVTAETEERFREFVNRVLREADVEIEPRYGRWVTDPAPSIVPPAEDE